MKILIYNPHSPYAFQNYMHFLNVKNFRKSYGTFATNGDFI